MNKLQKALIALVLPVVLLGTAGCATGTTNSTSNDKSTVAQKPADDPKPSYQKKLGEVVTYKDGLTVSVSAPAAYAPTEYAAGTDGGGSPVVFNVVITNNSKKNVEVGGFPQVNSGGAQAHSITDLTNNIGVPPNTTLLPTQSITFQDAYMVVDPADITYMINPGVLYQQAIFTSK